MEIEGIDFDWGNPSSLSKLSQCILAKDQEKVIKYLKKGANPNIPDNRGYTSLHYACRYEDMYDVIKLLIKHGAYVLHETHEGVTPICIAARSGSWRIVELLLKKGASVHKAPNSVMSSSPLHYACSGKSLVVMKVMLDHGALVNCKDLLNDVTPIMVSSSVGETDACHLLIHYGADVTLSDSNDRTAMHYAAARDKVDILDVLVDASNLKTNVCVNKAWSPDGWTLLMEAAQFGALRVTQWLLDHGAETCAMNKSGLLALHLAAHNSDTCFKLLIQSTPVSAINKTSCVTKLNHINSNNSIPYLLLDRRLFGSFEDLFSVPLDPAVYNCPNFDNNCNELQSPLSYLLKLDCSYENKEHIIKLYILNKIPIDPKYRFGYSKTLLDSLLNFHCHHNRICCCVNLFLLLVENGARLEVIEKRLSELNYELYKYRVLPFFISKGYTYGIGCILKFFHDFNVASFAKEYCRQVFLNENGDFNPAPLTSGEITSLDYIFQYCTYSTLIEIRRTLHETFRGEEPNYCNDLKSSISSSLFAVHSLKHLVRLTIRNDPKFSSKYVKNAQLPQAVIKYILYDEIMEAFEGRPPFPLYS